MHKIFCPDYEQYCLVIQNQSYGIGRMIGVNRKRNLKRNMLEFNRV